MKRGDIMHFRHEIKHEISLSDMMIIKQRLSAIAYDDENSVNGKYTIRSLYFDNISDKALREKINGVNRREKFRIRCYNYDTSVIRLEKKIKHCDMTGKLSASITPEQVQSIINGNIEWMLYSKSQLIVELYSKMTTEGLKPKNIVDYTREPFVFPAGNVRVTIDYNIRSSLNCTDFFNENCVTLPVSDSIILEVKWDSFLPDIIKDAVSIENLHSGAFSKYATGRIYG